MRAPRLSGAGRSLIPPVPWFRRFQAAVELINKVEVGKFSAVLARLMKNLHTKVGRLMAALPHT